MYIEIQQEWDKKWDKMSCTGPWASWRQSLPLFYSSSESWNDSMPGATSDDIPAAVLQYIFLHADWLEMSQSVNGFLEGTFYKNTRFQIIYSACCPTMAGIPPCLGWCTQATQLHDTPGSSSCSVEIEPFVRGLIEPYPCISLKSTFPTHPQTRQYPWTWPLS